MAMAGREGNWTRPLLWVIRTSSQLSADWHRGAGGRECSLNFEETGYLRLGEDGNSRPQPSPPQLCCVIHSYTSSSGLIVRARCKWTDGETTRKNPTEPLQ